MQEIKFRLVNPGLKRVDRNGASTVTFQWGLTPLVLKR